MSEANRRSPPDTYQWSCGEFGWDTFHKDVPRTDYLATFHSLKFQQVNAVGRQEIRAYEIEIRGLENALPLASPDFYDPTANQHRVDI